MSWQEVLGKGVHGLLPWVGVYHHLCAQRDAGGGLIDDDAAELLDNLEESLARVSALACCTLRARLSCGGRCACTLVRALGLLELEVDDSAVLHDGAVVEVAVEQGPRGRWYHFTGVAESRGEAAGLWHIALVASHGSRFATPGEDA